VAGGLLQKGGFFAAALGIVAGIGGLITANPFLLGVSQGLLLGGSVLNIAGAFITPIRTDTSSDSKRDSPTYGFTQFHNRIKGDAPIPIQYGRQKVAPIIAQAFTTPRGLEDYDDFARASRAPGQALSMQMVGGKGPIVGVEQVFIDEQPLYEKMQNEDGSPIDVGKGTGSKTAFKLPGKRIVVSSMEVFVNGTLKGWNLANRTSLFTADGVNTLYTADYTSDRTIGDLAPEYGLTIKINNALVGPEDTFRPLVWLEGDGRLLRIDTGIPLPNGAKLSVAYVVRQMSDGIKVDTQDGETTLTWKTAPASGAKITARYLRKLISGVSVELRLGAENQLPLTGFDEIRNTFAVNQEPVAAGITGSTNSDVDNFILDFASSPSGMRSIDDKDGSEGPVSVFLTIEYKPFGASSSAWVKLRDPHGARTTGTNPKGASEFEFWAVSGAQQFFALSVRGVLSKLADQDPTGWGPKLTAFKRQRYDYRVTRTNARKYLTNSLYFDQLTVISRQDVLDEWLTHPGTWLLGLHGYASEKLNGSIPNVTCIVTGISTVKKIITSSNVDSWVADKDAQFNPVWAACHLWADRQDGGGEQYSLDDIDMESAKAAAAWCEELVPKDTLANSATEVRARLDISIDTRQSLMAAMTDMLAAAFVVPVLQGDKLRFAIDQEVDLDDVPTFYDDGAGEDNATKKGAGMQHVDPADDVTELYLDFFDEDEEWKRQPVIVSPREPAENRRIKRTEIVGCTRRTQATRVAAQLYKAATHAPSIPDVSLMARPDAIDLEAGDVIRFISQRFAFDGYLRVVRMDFSASDYWVQLDCREYVPEVYGQQRLGARILTQPRVTAQPTIADSAQMAASVRRVA
jgi:hypothetical protein